ncbi:hypothetical protein CMV_008762 [Castanea mollissima]|uniref:Uncharacterized protein n=1 Tax=Castanea mollissima TaxID=60419 RepID=A0A8J4R6X0_9ROSI|nr:hypothetical protein CMV_008762 [Castanea mollissima]
MPHSLIRLPKLIKQECRLENLKNVNFEENCMLLDSESASGLLNQVVENIGILPNRVCGSARSTNYFPSESEDGDKSVDRQFSNHFPSETEGVEYEDRDVPHNIYLSETEMPKWFNHQSVENSIFFWVGRKFPKLAVCFIVPGPLRLYLKGYVCISINSYKKREFECNLWSGEKWYLRLFSPSQRSLQGHLNESNPTDQNHVEVTYSTHWWNGDNANCIKRWGVHVECTCPPQESAIPNLPLLTDGHDDDDDVDYWCELPFYGSDDKEEYQAPLRRRTPILCATNNNSSSNESSSSSKKGGGGAVPNSKSVVPLDKSFTSTNSSCITRPLVEILRHLNKRIPDNIIKSSDDDHTLFATFIPWYHANQMLSFYAPRSVSYKALTLRET